MLLVAVDPLPADVLEAAGEIADDASSISLLPAGAGYVLIKDKAVFGGTADARLAHAAQITATGPRRESDDVVVLKAGPGDAILVLYLQDDAGHRIDEVRHEDGVGTEGPPAEQDLADMPEPMLPLGLEAVHEPAQAAVSDDWVEPLPPPDPNRALSSLFDRLAEDASSNPYKPKQDLL